ncbi:unnamed protein product [Rhizoctonia solani]|uniref:Uncharacterized protein n=1 Tax=Rhizoctonia solani TaxID=456999 RepID=A0A8H3BTJ5_9AGAM|nr:unnamed protein product [Rhizoctonia solani]
MQLIQHTSSDSTTPERAIKESDRIMVPETYFISVQVGLRRLTKSTSVVIAASGFCGASAWYTSAGRVNRDHREPLLQPLVAFLKEQFSEVNVPNKISGGISNELLVDLMKALAVETSYMIWDLEGDAMNKELKSLIKLCLLKPPGKSMLLDGPARRELSMELAVIAALMNDYQRIPDDEIDWLSRGGHDKFGIRPQYIKAQEAYQLRYPYPPNSHQAYSRQWHAVWIAELLTKNPKYLEANSDALLFLGLAGILRSFRMNSSQFNDVVELFIKHLKSNKTNLSNRMSLPFVLISSCDIQSQVAQDILAAFHDQPLITDYKTEQAKIDLLQCLIEHGQWIEFRPVFLIEILKMRETSGNKEFQRKCILALDKYWFVNSAFGFDTYNLPAWRLLIDFDLIRILLSQFLEWLTETEGLGYFFELITEGSGKLVELRFNTISCFAKLARTIAVQNSLEGKTHSGAPKGTDRSDSQGTPKISTRGDVSSISPPSEVLDEIKKLLLFNEELFAILFKDIAYGSSTQVDPTDLGFWRKAILDLPGKLIVKPTLQTQTGTTAQPSPGLRNQAPSNIIAPAPATSSIIPIAPDSRAPIECTPTELRACRGRLWKLCNKNANAGDNKALKETVEKLKEELKKKPQWNRGIGRHQGR